MKHAAVTSTFWSEAAAAAGPDAAGRLDPLADVLHLPAGTDRLHLAHDTLVALATGAPFLCHLMGRDPDALVWLTSPEVWQSERPAVAMATHLGDPTRGALVEAGFMSRARRFRARELMRIASRDLLNLASVAETTLDLSVLADTCLAAAYRFARKDADERFGPPTSSLFADDRGFAVMALGKLGAAELNFSSDIDIVFLYAQDGETSGGSGRAQWPVPPSGRLRPTVREASPGSGCPCCAHDTRPVTCECSPT